MCQFAFPGQHHLYGSLPHGNHTVTVCVVAALPARAALAAKVQGILITGLASACFRALDDPREAQPRLAGVVLRAW